MSNFLQHCRLPRDISIFSSRANLRSTYFYRFHFSCSPPTQVFLPKTFHAQILAVNITRKNDVYRINMNKHFSIESSWRCRPCAKSKQQPAARQHLCACSTNSKELFNEGQTTGRTACRLNQPPPLLGKANRQAKHDKKLSNYHLR